MADRRDTVILTVSDGAHRGSRQDTSGDALAERLRGAGWTVQIRRTVPDEVDRITEALTDAAADDVALVVTTGGTGLGPRDVTPEATRQVADRPVPGLAERMRAVGRQVTPMADLSRAEAAVLDTTLVINTPGSPKGAVESLDAVLDLLPHAVDLLAGTTQAHPTGHGEDGVAHQDVPQDTGSVGGPSSAQDVGADDDHHEGHDHGSGHGDPAEAAAARHESQESHEHGHAHDDPCALAHAEGVPDERRPSALVCVYASPLSSLLLSWGRDLGYQRLVLVEPGDLDHHAVRHADEIVPSVTDAGVDDDADVVMTDHERDDLVDLCEQMLGTDARWLGLMGSARHTAPHVEGLRERGWEDQQIGRIERPVGLDIGSKTPPEIALAILAGIVADRQGRREALTS